MIKLIRHAESTWNSKGDRSRNVPITENGKRVCKTLKGEYDLVICSTLRRARETLDNSRIVYSKVIYTELCREHLDNNPSNCYNGEIKLKESEEEFENRVKEFNDYLKELSKTHKRIAVITHSVFLHKMTGFWFKNCYYMNYTPK